MMANIIKTSTIVIKLLSYVYEYIKPRSGGFHYTMLKDLHNDKLNMNEMTLREWIVPLHSVFIYTLSVKSVSSYIYRHSFLTRKIELVALL